MDNQPEQAGKVPTTSDADLVDALRDVVDPELGADIVALGMVRSVRRKGSTARVDLALTVAACPLRGQLRDDVERALYRIEGIESVDVAMAAMDQQERSALMARARRLAEDRSATTEISPTTRVLAVVSGKGGVGKSSVAVNLAVALARTGTSVGLLDADIWGFSVPRMLGIDAELQARSGKMVPIELPVGAGLLKVVSMGFLSGEDEAIMWRGLMLNRAVQHFLEDVAWGELDYLIVDMPPGTGDVQMGLARMLPRTELLVVTTPALAAQRVAGRAADMAKKGHLRIAGVIENMAGFICEHGEAYQLFGSGGGARLANDVGAPLVGSIPIDARVSKGGDEGQPIALTDEGPVSIVFKELATRVREEIAPLRSMETCSARLVRHVEDALNDKVG